MKVKFSEWKSATNDLPTEDGEYLVLRFDDDGECYSGMRVSYTVKYGWNTHIDIYGEYCSKNAFSYSEDERAFWAKVQEEKE